jgi:hypothetical protein
MWEILSEIFTLNRVTLIILFITLVVLIWETKELKKSTGVQAYQSVLSNYIACISRDRGGEPLYHIYLEGKSVKDDDLFLFSALMNTFEMLYIQKNKKIIQTEVWDPWKEYFIELLKRKNEYRVIWEVLKDKNLYHKGLTKIINEELK